MKKFVFSFLVIAAVLVAGCAGTGGGEVTIVEGTGLEIIDFSIEPAEVRAGSSASFILTAENQGNHIVNKTKVLFTVILPTDWDWTGSKKIISTGKHLMPEDPSIDRIADIFSKRIRSGSPTLSRGQTREDDVTLRAYYDYQTDSNGLVFLYPYGETIEDTTEFDSDNAPIKLNVRSSPVAPVLEGPGESFTLVIDITNVGSGKVFLPGLVDSSGTSPALPPLGINEYNKVNLSVDIRGITEEHDSSEPTSATWRYWLVDSECRGEGDYDESTIELYGKTNPKATIMCDVKAKEKPTTKEPISIVVTARYGYYTETSNEITILGRQ